MRKARKKQKMTPSIEANSSNKNQNIVGPASHDISEAMPLKKSDDRQSN